ncbi:tRNA-binding protein [Gangjinia marincola]|uniref:tRNA-binding protein n=1 Tax=Gangjinia marincola TaxID=578463 RepID=A0ABN1MDN8_9FLAO
MTITWADFEKIEIRVGTIIAVEQFPKARNPSFKLSIDFGEEIGIKKSSAQITALYSPDALIGTQIAAVINFPPKQIANFMSECLVLGAVQGKEVTLITLDKPSKNGLRIS